jgi:hypothetical protein
LKANAAPNKAISKAKKDDEKKAEKPVVEAKECKLAFFLQFL